MNPSPPEPDKPVSFEEALHQLEAVVRDLEDGEISLEDALARYESGVALLRQCYGRLKSAEQKVLLLTGESSDGKPICEPFEHTSTDPRRRARKPESQ
jgi:exodeoxyribonuclease VII small subunit